MNLYGLCWKYKVLLDCNIYKASKPKHRCLPGRWRLTWVPTSPLACGLWEEMIGCVMNIVKKRPLWPNRSCVYICEVCRFDNYSGEWLYFIYSHFSALVNETRRWVMFNYYSNFSKKWGTERLNTGFTLPTLLWEKKVKFLFYYKTMLLLLFC